MTRPVWWICFGDRAPAWVRRVTAPGYRHVFAVRWLDGRPLLVEWGHMGLAVDYLAEPARARAFARFLARETTEILAVPGMDAPRGVWPRIAAVSCVTPIKHLVGLRSRALTPWQLRRALRRLPNCETVMGP